MTGFSGANCWLLKTTLPVFQPADGLKSAMVRLFTPWKLANTTSEASSSTRPPCRGSSGHITVAPFILFGFCLGFFLQNKAALVAQPCSLSVPLRSVDGVMTLAFRVHGVCSLGSEPLWLKGGKGSAAVRDHSLLWTRLGSEASIVTEQKS